MEFCKLACGIWQNFLGKTVGPTNEHRVVELSQESTANNHLLTVNQAIINVHTNINLMLWSSNVHYGTAKSCP